MNDNVERKNNETNFVDSYAADHMGFNFPMFEDPIESQPQAEDMSPELLAQAHMLFQSEQNGNEIDSILDQSVNEPGQIINLNGNSQITLKQIFINSPIHENLLCPSSYRINYNGVFKGDEQITYLPIMIESMIEYLDKNTESVELLWWKDGHWKSEIVNKNQITSTSEIVKLSQYGLPVTSNNAKKLIDYLYCFEMENHRNIPSQKTVSSMGWVIGYESFMLGEQFVTQDNNPDTISFYNDECEGDRYAKGYYQKGNYDAWINCISVIQKYPMVCMAFYASFSSILIPILESSNFIIDYSGPTSQGKTSTLRVAASVWGNPDESNTNTVIHSWNMTPVFLERISALQNNLPLLMDDSKQIKHNKVSDFIYGFQQGQGRGRGNIKGVRDVLAWKSIMISTGEQKLTNYTTNGGAHARVITLWHVDGPFESSNQTTGDIVNALNEGIQANFGFAGRKFVEWLINHPEMKSAVKDTYKQYKQELSDLAGNNSVFQRISEYFAVIKTTAHYVNQVLDLSWDYEAIIEKAWKQMYQDSKTIDQTVEALSTVHSWACSNQDFFEGKSSGDYSKTCYGKWDDRYLAIYPHILEKCLDENGFTDYKGVIRTWCDRGWAETNKNDNVTKTMRVNNTPTRVIALKYESIKQILQIDDWEADQIDSNRVNQFDVDDTEMDDFNF